MYEKVKWENDNFVNYIIDVLNLWGKYFWCIILDVGFGLLGESRYGGCIENIVIFVKIFKYMYWNFYMNVWEIVKKWYL